MKKIVIAVQYISGGGAERAASVWASKLADIGYDVTLLTYFRVENEYSLSLNVKRLTVANSEQEYHSLGFIERYRAIRKCVKSCMPSIVISFLQNMQVWMMLACIGLKIKRVETVRISPWHTTAKPLHKLIWRLCFATGDLTILQSNDQKPFFSRRIQKKCVVVPNTVDERYEKFGKTEFSEKIRNFVAAGRISEQKNYPLMIEAFVRAHDVNPDITLDIYGAGKEEYIKKIQNIIDGKDASDYIRLCGRTNDLHSVLLDKDAFIMSSDFEGLPNALIEAMAIGLVSVCTDCKTGPRDLIIDGENGFLVPVGDSDELSRKIALISRLSAEEISSLGKAARDYIINYCGETNTVEKLTEAIDIG